MERGDKGLPDSLKKILVFFYGIITQLQLPSIFSDAGLLKRDELANDAERIRGNYYNRGYLDVQVSAQWNRRSPGRRDLSRPAHRQPRRNGRGPRRRGRRWRR